MKLSNIPFYQDKGFFLLKFSNNKQHLESLQSGNLYMNNFQYFIELEKTEGKKGMGDLFEATQVLNEINFELRDSDTDEIILPGKAKRMTLSVNELLKQPIFCLTSLDGDMLEITRETEECYETRVVFTEEQKERFLVDFGKYVLLIPFDKFMDRLFHRFTEEGLCFVAKKVMYDDFSVNNYQRIKSFEEQNNDVFYWKDESIAYQSEYRIVVLNEGIQAPLTVNIGDLREFTTLISTEQLLNGQYGAEIKKHSNSKEI